MIEIIGKNETERRNVRIAQIKRRSVGLDPDLMRDVSAIVDDVRQRGDEALLEYTARFDGVTLSADQLVVDQAMLRESASRVDSRLRDALRDAIANVRAFHERQLEKSWQFEPKPGVILGQRIGPIERVGVYVPGGTAAYPSSVVMNVVPARIAGVERIIMVTPPRTLAENPAIAAAVVELNVTEVYGVGGAQAVAALAFGTATVPRVDKITGPGNKYVAAAKKLVFGVVGIDSIAGPTEVVILADETARADFVAADLLAQAEHGEDASAVLITTSETLAREVADELKRQVETVSRRSIIAESFARYGAVIVVDDLDGGCVLVNELAPEHLEIIARDDDAVSSQIKHAGAIFFGPYTPEAVGDYFAGPNHVLPTGGAARFSSALGVYDFVKRTSMMRYSREELTSKAGKISVLAEAEGLNAHARSALIRSE